MDWKIFCRCMLVTMLFGFSLVAHAQKTVTYIHTDALGSVVATSDEAGNVTHRREYEPYGYELGGLSDGVGYTGHVQDPSTGLVYMQQRYYDPQIGRFLSVDPITAYEGDLRQFNRYAYAFNNPYRFVDPDGRQSVAACAANPANAAVCAEAGITAGGNASGAAGAGAQSGGILRALARLFSFNNSANEGESDRPTGDDVKIDDKIAGQLEGRGWTEGEVRDLTRTDPAGTSVDNTGGRNDPATVYGTRDGGHVIVNDKTGNVVQVSDKQSWNPDPRIEWKDSP